MKQWFTREDVSYMLGLNATQQLTLRKSLRIEMAANPHDELSTKTGYTREDLLRLADASGTVVALLNNLVMFVKKTKIMDAGLFMPPEDKRCGKCGVYGKIVRAKTNSAGRRKLPGAS